MTFLGEVASGRGRGSANVVSRGGPDEALVLPIPPGAADLDSIYTFNETGTQLWSLIEKGLDPAGLIAHLQDLYGLPLEQATLDAHSFLKELSEEGLVEPA